MDFAAILAGLKGLYDLLDTSKQREAVRVVEREVAELQAQVLNLTQAQLAQSEKNQALLRENEALRKEMAELRESAHDRERYELLSPAPGLLVYALKAPERGVEASHWLCQKCYGKGVKAALQDLEATHADPSRRFVTLVCPECGMEAFVARDVFARAFCRS